METKFNGAFGLVEIKKIVLRNNGLNTLYLLKFSNDKRILIATILHCFLNNNGEAKTVRDLVTGDIIWINTSELSDFKQIKI